MKKKRRFSFGPGVLVTAAFIGPGTVMTASKAGSEFGFLLLWAVAFSVLATIILQEMAARMGIVTGDGLSQALKTTLTQPLVRFCVLGLVLLAILVGNAAYQTGNILGAASGVKAMAIQSQADPGLENNGTIDPANKNRLDPDTQGFQNALVVLVAAIALAVIWIGRIDLLQTLLSILVALMSVLFIYAAFKSGPDLTSVAAGFVPRIPSGGEWIVIGIIGTTVVPYNLFLHASAAAEQWGIDPEEPESEDLYRRAIASSRWDTVISVALGGLVTCAILITAAVAFHSVDPDGATAIHGRKIPLHEVAIQLEPALGRNAKLFFAIGLFAAGLTSAITAPIAAGFAVSGCFGWSGKLQDWRLKTTATCVVLAGVLFAVWFGSSPKETIVLAQVANGLLLPIIAVLLLMIANQTGLMKQYKNRTLTNVLGVFVILIATLIAVRQFYSVSNKVRDMLKPVSEEVSVNSIELFSAEVPIEKPQR